MKPQPPPFTANPPWVNKILRSSWDLLLSRSGDPRFLPVPSKHKKPRFAEYGCGYYGCVFPTSMEGVVFKITSDASEIDFVNFLLRNPHVLHDGMVRYLGVLNLPYQYGHRDTAALWREEATARGQRGPGVSFLSDLREVAQDVQRRAKRTSTPHERKKLLTSEVYDDVLRTADHLSKWSGFSKVGQAIRHFLMYGIVLADVHANNVGFPYTPAVRDEPEERIIVDPGVVSSLVYDLKTATDVEPLFWQATRRKSF